MPRLDFAFRYLQVLLTSHLHPDYASMSQLFFVSASKLTPFFLLVLATPRVSAARRAVGFAAAIVFYFSMDMAMAAMWHVPPFLVPEPTTLHIVSCYAWDMLGRWLMPYLLWLLLAGRQIPALAAIWPQAGGGRGGGGRRDWLR
ncbi:hypothetical protein KP004_13105 [Geomonas oryzisoli]|uniref:Uncharacterized protein n=1 Tax=Geomonas oryzisoli TaxID=2847992 RepID=A0ABX8J311_9BACT|nr:hypothetical protein [Geomonas oryzisoli]QWV92158.1 hypothetical protein KP004_13105 [Geomonas oryzisoli]